MSFSHMAGSSAKDFVPRKWAFVVEKVLGLFTMNTFLLCLPKLQGTLLGSCENLAGYLEEKLIKFV